MSLLFAHITATTLSMILGYNLIVFSKKPIETLPKTLFSLVICLVISAITGIFLNTTEFSPFHILAIVTLSTSPFIFSNFYKKNYPELKRNLFCNFCGLNLAFVGAMAPQRYLGRRLWKPIEYGLGLDKGVTTKIWLGLLILAVIIVIVQVARMYRVKNFFATSTN
jgi:hypothetical protein